MADVFVFIPRAQREARQNLEQFVQDCRERLAVFGADLDFDADVWDLTKLFLGTRGKRSVTTMNFTTWGAAKRETGGPMPEPFKSFAKAYMRYQQGLRPSLSFEGRLIALRALCAAATECEGAPDACMLLPFHFNRAAQLIQERVQESSAYQYGIQLELIANTMNDCGLLAHPGPWRSPIRRRDCIGKVGKEFDERRIAKLPTRAALEALAAIFKVAEEVVDVMVTSAVAIMCSAPERINEVFRLGLHSEVQQPNSAGDPVYGLRWYPSKGAAPQVKWTVQSMADTVKKAIARVRTVSEPARALALWYEKNPTRIFLPPDLEHLRGVEVLRLADLSQILFEHPVKPSVTATWCQTYGVKRVARGRVLFADVEAAVLAMLPRNFPVAHPGQRLRYSEALFLVRKNELHDSRAIYRCMFFKLESNDIYGRLSQQPTLRDSIFEKFGYREPDGSKISVTTHQFRHYLNTVAQIGGLSQLDIALWSGRSRISENKAYDHVSDRDVLQLMRDAVTVPGGSLSPAKVPESALVMRAEFAKVKVPTAHATDFGYCGHDFTMLPCQAHQDCLNCDEHVCVKGDTEKERRLRLLVGEVNGLLATAEQAERDNLAGASRWVAHQRRTLERAEELLRMMDDPAIPNHAVIRVAVAVMPSELVMAVQDRQRLLERKDPAGHGAAKLGEKS